MKSLKNKFYYAYCGLKILFHDKSVCIQLGFSIAALILGFLFSFNILEFCVLITICMLVVVFEAINSVIEHIMDMMQSEYDPKVKVIKDMAAGVVLVASIGAFIVGVLLFGGKLLWILM